LPEERYVVIRENNITKYSYFQAAPPSSLAGQENKLVNTSNDCDDVPPFSIIIDLCGLNVVFKELIVDISSATNDCNSKPISLLLPLDQTCVKRILTLNNDPTVKINCYSLKSVELKVSYVYTITCNNISLNITSIIFNLNIIYPPKKNDTIHEV
jgi:hypothetical protein